MQPLDIAHGLPERGTFAIRREKAQQRARDSQRDAILMQRFGIIGILEEPDATARDACGSIGKGILHVDDALPEHDTRALHEPLEPRADARRIIRRRKTERRHGTGSHALRSPAQACVELVHERIMPDGDDGALLFDELGHESIYAVGVKRIPHLDAIDAERIRNDLGGLHGTQRRAAPDLDLGGVLVSQKL